MEQIFSRRNFLEIGAGIIGTTFLMGSQDASALLPKKEKSVLAKKYRDDINERIDAIKDDINFIRIKDYKFYKEVEFDSMVNVPEIGEHKVRFEFYGSGYGSIIPKEFNKQGPFPTVIMLPITEGITRIERGLALELTKNNMSAMILEKNQDYHNRMGKTFKQITNMNNFYRSLKLFNITWEQMLLDSMQMLPYIEREADLDENNIGLSGASLGAIRGATVMGLEDKIKAGFLVAGGGNIGHIFSYTTMSEVVDARNSIIKNLGTDRDWIKKEINKVFKWDPLDYAQFINPVKTFMVFAGNDKSVPYSTGNKLSKAIFDGMSAVEVSNKMQKAIIFKGIGHEGLIFKMGQIKRMAKDFFKQHLTN